MLKPVERMIARRYLRAKNDEGFVSTITCLSFLGILLGVAALIVVSAVLDGGRQKLVDQILSLNGHISVERQLSAENNSSLAADDPVIALIAQSDNVKAVTPLVEEQVLLTGANGAAGGIVLGLRAADLSGESRFVGDLHSGDLHSGEIRSVEAHRGEIRDLSGWNVFLSLGLARGLNAVVGDRVELLSPKGYETPFGWSPRVKKVTIAGIFRSANDKPLVLMPMDKAQLFFRLKGRYSRLEITTEDTERIDQKLEELTKMLGSAYRVQSWKDFYRVFVSALDIERIVVLIVLTLIIIVAAFNIVAGQTMLVQEKGKGIAVLRTMGADKRAVMRIFVMTGAVIGVVGTVLGTVLGVLIALKFGAIIAFFQSTPLGGLMHGELAWLARVSPVINVKLVVFMFFFSILLSVLAALYPALRAADHDPVEALRYE